MKSKSFASPSRFFTCYGPSSFCSFTPPLRHLFKKTNTFTSPWTCYLGSKASFTSTAAMFGEWERDVNWKLRKLHDPTWGYTIFRTVYTPASDTQFPLCLRKLDSWIKHEIYEEFNRPSRWPRNATDPVLRIESNDEMYSRYKNEVVENRERLDGADVEV
ncbi:hypothetical protein B0O99DRAFT_631624 [Bisporella sp. PMI_857]|nr:hypothetical protein B0O99DRAFT_631624 [Bisporella sp. PMI_857]